MIFVGTHARSLDDKGRLVLPSKFRTHFAEDGVVSRGRGCVQLHTAAAFKEMVDRLTGQMRDGEIEPRVLWGLGAGSEDVRLDGQGRVTLPSHLREGASLGSEVVICGALGHIEIWNPDAWAAVAPDLDRSVAEAFAHGAGI